MDGRPKLSDIKKYQVTNRDIVALCKRLAREFGTTLEIKKNTDTLTWAALRDAKVSEELASRIEGLLLNAQDYRGR